MNSPRTLMSQLMRLGNNPQVVEQALFQQYPQLKVLANQMKQSGLSPMQFVMQYARQNNIPIQENQMMSMYQELTNMIPKTRY